MAHIRNIAIDELARDHGIILDYGQNPSLDFLARHQERDKAGAPVPGKYGSFDAAKLQLALDELMAQDAPTASTYAQPTLVTAPNAGILSLLTTYIDPKLIDVLLSPTKAAEIYGEAKKGDWTLQTAAFGLVENTGEVSAYGDFNEVGMTGINVNWPQRQSFLFQAIMEYGDLESDRMALARIDWVARKRIAVAIALGYFLNLTYFFGVQGLNNYGGLNDPGLSPALTPSTKVAGGTSWQNALPTEIVSDVQAMFNELQGNTHGTGGNLDLEADMTLALSPVSLTYLMNPNQYGLMAAGMLKTIFPNLKIKQAVQYQSGTTYSAQLIANEIMAQRTTEAAFNEKMRAHRIVPGLSSFRQKTTAGTWGTIIYRPIGIATMAGI